MPTGFKGFLQRVKLAERQGGVYVMLPVLVAPCFYCQWWFPVLIMTTEHLENLRDGGRNTQDNLRLACGACNASRQRLTATQKLQGLAYSKPLRTPLLVINPLEGR